MESRFYYVYEKKYINNRDLFEWKEGKKKGKEEQDKRNEEREGGDSLGGVGKGILVFALGWKGDQEQFD